MVSAHCEKAAGVVYSFIRRVVNMKKKTWLAGAAGTAGVLAILAGGASFFYETAVPRKSRISMPGGKKEETEFQKSTRLRTEAGLEWLKERGTEKLYITSHDGLRLKATFLPAQEYTEKTVLAVHGYRNYGEREFAAMASFIHGLGYNLLMVDDRGHGESGGEFVCYGGLDHYDCKKWIEYLVLRFGERAEIFLYGISMGAATVMITAGDELPEQVKGVIADCGYTTVMEQFQHVLKSVYHMPSFPLLPLTRWMTKWRAGYDFHDCEPREALKRATLPFLFIHGDKDDFVPTWMGYENYDACASEEKDLLLIEDAGHAESYFLRTEEYEAAVREFLEEWSGERE